MASVNKVIIVGNLGNDPEVRQFDNGNKIATISVATSERWNDRQTGEQREHTEWHRIIFNNRLAEIVEQYLRKGSSVYVEGSLRTRKWTDQNGQDRYSTEIRADSMQMLGGRANGGDYQNQGGYNGGNSYNQPRQNYNNQNNYQNNHQSGYQNQGYNNQPQNNFQNQGGYGGYQNQGGFNNQQNQGGFNQSAQGFGGNGFNQGNQGGQGNQNYANQPNQFAAPAPQANQFGDAMGATATQPSAPKPTTPPPAKPAQPADSSVADDDMPF